MRACWLILAGSVSPVRWCKHLAGRFSCLGGENTCRYCPVVKFGGRFFVGKHCEKVQPVLVDTGGQSIFQPYVQATFLPRCQIFALVIRVFIAESLTNIGKYHPFLPTMLYYSDSSAVEDKGFCPRKNLSKLLMRQCRPFAAVLIHFHPSLTALIE